jgi:hypothetical protein
MEAVDGWFCYVCLWRAGVMPSAQNTIENAFEATDTVRNPNNNAFEADAEC